MICLPERDLWQRRDRGSEGLDGRGGVTARNRPEPIPRPAFRSISYSTDDAGRL